MDRVLETGIPVEIERNGRILRIVAEPSVSRLAGWFSIPKPGSATPMT